jgi:hypothetical protein
MLYLFDYQHFDIRLLCKRSKKSVSELYGTKPDRISAYWTAHAVQEMGIREVIRLIRFTPKRSSCQTQRRTKKGSGILQVGYH